MPKVKAKPKVAAPTQVETVAIDRLVPTPDNRRKPINDASVRSLAQSIKRDGMLQPIVVRVHPTEPDRWEIRAGERRWRAAKLAGLDSMPVIVRKLDNESALAVTIAENIQRKDLHPLEEAETIQIAFDREYDLKAIAAKLGRSVQYVARRASLTRLAKVWRTEIMKPNSPAGRLSAAHLELIARLPEPTQVALADEDFWPVFGRGFPTVDDLRKIIDNDLHSLAAVPWDPDDETLDPKAGSCLNCPKRSSKEPMLFSEADGPQNGKATKNDRCLDPRCFERKHVAHLQRCESKLRDEHPTLRLIQIGFESLGAGIQEAFGDRVVGLHHPIFVKSGAPRAAPAMQLDGPKAGKLVFVDFGDSVAGNGRGRPSQPRGGNGHAGPMTLAERKDRLQKRRDAHIVKHVDKLLRELTAEKAVEIVSPSSQRTIDRAAGTKVFDPAALLVAFGSTKRADFVDGGEAWKEYDSLRDSEPIREAAAALLAVVQVWIKRLRIQGGHTVSAQAEDARRMCQILGVDFLVLFTEARRAIPQPKSWAEPEEPDPPTVSTEPIDDDPQPEEEPSTAEFETEAVAAA